MEQASVMVILFSKYFQRKLTLATEKPAPDPGETVHLWEHEEG